MANGHFYPKTTSTRRVIDLSGMWKFALDKNNEAEANNWHKRLPVHSTIPVPSSFNDLFAEKDIREFVGDLWYETDFYVSPKWKELDLELRFSGVTHEATIYVNGEKVAEHRGGYTPFTVSIDDVVHFDKKNTLVVRVENELKETMVPAGKTMTRFDGKQMVKSNTDFFHYAGIQRQVYLVATPKESIVDISVRFELTEDDAKVFYTAKTTGENEVRIKVADESGRFVAEAVGKENMLEVKNVQLWQPLNAYLYTFTIQIINGSSVIDEYREEIGIRTVRVEGNQLLINNEPVYLKGFSKQEDSELRGAGFSLPFLKRDFELLKWSGANCVRTANFPHAEEFYQLADREGIIVINEVSASGLVTSQPSYFEPDAGDTKPFFTKETVQQETKEQHLLALEELINRDKNHASVCIWSLANEPDTNYDEAAEYFKDIFAAADKLDVQKRPRTVALSMYSTPEECKITELCDIISLNRYYGWDVLSGYESSDANEALREELTEWEKKGKPVVVTAFGAESLPGEMKLPSVQWSENYQVETLMEQQEIFNEFPSVAGELVWSFADFQTVEGLTSVDGNKSGIFTRNRQPKMAAYVLKSKWEQ